MAATPLITEFVASNSGGLRDVDGDTSDWIEIYNPTDSPVDLAGWQLTDDPDLNDLWTFPTTVVPADSAIVVFASDKDRAVAGEQLHTNFRLSSSGDYLLLRDADGNVISEFAPEYPPQTTNISYGVEFDTDVLVAPGASASFAVPGGAIGTGVPATTWAAAGFDDSAWSDVTVGVGTNIEVPGFNVEYAKARSYLSYNGTISSIAVAEAVLDIPVVQQTYTVESAPVINYLGSGSSANFGDDLPFPTQTMGQDINHFAIRGTGQIQIPTAGLYTFGVNSDDGFRLRLTDGEQTFQSQFDGFRGASDTLATFNLNAGSYDVELLMFEATVGAHVEFFAAPGNRTTFDDSFRLVGDTAGGGLAVTHTPEFNPFVQTDVTAEVAGANTASSYLRVPFEVDDAASIDTLSFLTLYNDGFVAWINGVEVARANAPATINSSSAATATRDGVQTNTLETFALPAAARSALVDGSNTLAIQLLNDAVGEDTLLMLPILIANDIRVGDLSFFATPTPGQANRDPIDGVLAGVDVDLPAGFYQTPQTVSLSHPDAAATIRYTTDGSAPTETNGEIYTGPITVDSTTVLRSAAFRTNYQFGPVEARSYLFLDDVLTQSNDNSPPPGWPSSWGTNVVDYGMDPEVIAAEGAEAVKDALLAIPTISVSTDLDNLFDESFGIYSNALQDGRDWERPASAEWINPDGSEGFSVGAGLRIRGGFSRGDFNPKHAFKLYFRGAYGTPELEYPVHGDRGVSTFKQLDLRTAQNYSWSGLYDPTNNFVAEVMARRFQRDLGQPYTRSTWFHLYLNGQYWGLYQTQERPNADYAESYFGGDASDYDVVKPGDDDKQVVATDGNLDAYTRLWSAAVARADDGVTPAFVDNDAYLAVQGLNPDGSDNPDLPVLLDVDNLITYMMISLHGGNRDAPLSSFFDNTRANNFFGIYDRTGRDGFQFFQHDAEQTFRDVNENRNGPYNDEDFETTANHFNPQWLHQQLMANDEYRIRFADAIQNAFFNDGPMSLSGVTSVLDESVAEIDTAVIAESARWGDGAFPDAPALTRQDFLIAIDELRSEYLPRREPIVIDQFRNTQLVLKDGNGNYTVEVDAPLYPGVNPPAFVVDGMRMHGGDVSAGSDLTFASFDGTVFYTTDGTDPRQFGGSLNPSADVYSAMVTTTDLLRSGATWRYDDSGFEPPADWVTASFDDASWSVGTSEFGYGDGDESTVIDGGPASNRRLTALFRTTFNNPAPVMANHDLTIRVRRDDGVAIYLNGVEVIRDNLPSGPLSSNTLATTFVSEPEESQWFEFSIDPTLLVPGQNTIAARVHQSSNGSSDLTFDAEVILRQSVGDTAVSIDQPVIVSARTLGTDGTWSALNRATFNTPSTPADASNLRVTELHYHPADPETTEFIELQNISGERISLGGVSFTDGIDFTFGDDAFLDAGGIVVLATDAAALSAAFASLNPAGGPSLIGGQYDGALSNGGEQIDIVDAAGQIIVSFEYDDKGDGWHPSTDGDGPSLTIVDVEGDYSSGANWRPSIAIGGTPGFIESAPVVAAEVVGRHLAYGGATAGYGPNAIAPDVTALLPGEMSSESHYSNYMFGINRLVIDIDNAAGEVSASDFEFAIGEEFTAIITPSDVSVVGGGGVDGSDRVVVTLPDESVQNTWLRVTVGATAATGLEQSDVFYFGNQVGDVSGSEANGSVRVNAIDALLTRFNQSPAADSAAIDNRYDINRDGRINAFDTTLVRANHALAGGLMMWTPPPAGMTPGVTRAATMAVTSLPAIVSPVNQSSPEALKPAESIGQSEPLVSQRVDAVFAADPPSAASIISLDRIKNPMTVNERIDDQVDRLIGEIQSRRLPVAAAFEAEQTVRRGAAELIRREVPPTEIEIVNWSFMLRETLGIATKL